MPTSWAAHEINATGPGWDKIISAGDLESGAGSDLHNPYVSSEEATILDINITPDGDWHVHVAREDWSNSGGGILKVKEYGGEYMEIPVSPLSSEVFISGSASISGIKCQYQLSEISIIKDASGIHETTVTYTVSD